MTPSIQPSPGTFILRFKHHRSTIFLHVDPMQKMSSVREELLKSLQQTNPSGKFNGHEIPTDASEILLARPMDINNLSLGWASLVKESDNDIIPAEDKKGKGKASTSTSKGRAKKDDITDCPTGYGIREGGVLAFKFRSEAEAEKKREEDEGVDVEEDKLDGETLVGEPVLEKWDVVVPSMEETYGEEGAAPGDDDESVPVPLGGKDSGVGTMSVGPG